MLENASNHARTRKYLEAIYIGLLSLNLTGISGIHLGRAFCNGKKSFFLMALLFCGAVS